MEYLDYAESIRGRAPSTVKEYGYDIANFMRYIIYRKKKNVNIKEIDEIDIGNFDPELLKEVNLTDLHSYMAYLDRHCNNSPRTRSRKTSSIRSFYRYLTDIRQFVDVNIAQKLEVPKLSKRNPAYLTLDECIHLLKTIEQTKNPIYRTRDRCIMILFLNCGLRLSELSGISIDDITEDRLRVIGKGNKERVIYLNKACMNAIADYLPYRKAKDEENALFISKRKQRMSNRAIQHRVKYYLQLAGFDTSIYTTHKLRHTAATLMYKYGEVDIRILQEILGHESVQTTQIYTHVDNDILRKAVKKNPLGDI